MRTRIISVFIIAVICASGICLSVEKDSERQEITLPDGRILKKPYIISRNPAGLNVGHEKGVVFVRFSEMSKEQQKKYNYKPEKAKAYLKRLAQSRRKRQENLSIKQAQTEENDDVLDYIPKSDVSLSTLDKLQSELNDLIREKTRLEKEYSDVSAGRVSPRGMPSDDVYMSYRGGKVYRKKRENYSKRQTKNVMEKRRRLKEIKSALEKNARRTTTVRNMISREKTRPQGIKKGRNMKY